MLLVASGSVEDSTLGNVLGRGPKLAYTICALLPHNSEPVQNGRTPNTGLVGQGRRPMLTSTA